MKNIALIISISAVILCSITQCKKHEPVNITLYNQPLEVIQKYIQGRWKFVYAKGGIAGNNVFYCDSCFVVFTSDNRYLTQFNDGPYLKNRPITWERGSYDGDSTWLMNFGGPDYVIDKIYYDTLIYHENMADCSYYHLIKSD
jgi:hypothetical protein